MLALHLPHNASNHRNRRSVRLHHLHGPPHAHPGSSASLSTPLKPLPSHPHLSAPRPPRRRSLAHLLRAVTPLKRSMLPRRFRLSGADAVLCAPHSRPSPLSPPSSNKSSPRSLFLLHSTTRIAVRSSPSPPVETPPRLSRENSRGRPTTRA